LLCVATIPCAVARLVAGRTGSTSNTLCAVTTCSRPHRLYVNCAIHRDYLSACCNGSTSTTSCIRMPRLVAWLVVDYFAHTVRPGASARRAARRAARHTVHRRLLRLRRVSGCLVMSRGSSSTTSPTPRVRVPRHVTRLVTRFVVDYFAHTARPGASARRATLHAARRQLLRPRRTSGCLGTSRDSSRGSSSTTSPTPRVQVPRQVARLITRLVVDYFAHAVGVLDRQTYQGGTRGSRLCGEDRDRETENSKVRARTLDTRFIQVRAAKVVNPTSCLGDQVWRPALGVGLSPEGLGMSG
jgi:hypothetical protein